MTGRPWCRRVLVGDPCARLLMGGAGLVATAAVLHHDRVGVRESQAFRAVNGLPDRIYRPLWVVMQLGSLGAAPALAVVVWLGGDRRLARRLLAGGSATWALAKLVKRIMNRPRPARLLPDARRRGREATGLGYVSGHAGVAVALGAGLLPHLPRQSRPVVVALMAAVSLSRLYVGAHLPLDVIGGASLGLAVDAALGLVGAHHPSWPPNRRPVMCSGTTCTTWVLAPGAQGWGASAR